MRILILSFALLAAPAFAAQPVTGRWLTDDRKAIVEIGPCGKTLCGRIARILAPTPEGPPRDTNNPDPKLRGRPIQGLAVLTGFTADGEVWRGRIYSPEEGKTYRSVLQLGGNGALKVKGCIAIICRTVIWTRAR